MGRPREHDQHTALALLDAAERIVDAGGPEALSVRAVAMEVGTTTRAVYSLFGSKHGLLVGLAARAFDMLGAGIRALPTSDDPAADLVDASVAVFRRLAVEHPSLFRIGVQVAFPEVRGELVGGAAAHALEGLETRVRRLDDAGLLGRRSVRDATTEFHALSEGLAALELRGLLRAGEEERLWRDALSALLKGFAALGSEPAPGDAG